MIASIVPPQLAAPLRRASTRIVAGFRSCRRSLVMPAVAVAGLLLASCAALDPELRQAIAEAGPRPEAARIKLRPFAQQGNETAIAQICIAYGRSIDYRVREPEREQAFAWCKHAANAGNAVAQYHLGMFYKSGIGTREDRGVALHWYQQAASQGHAEADNEARGLAGKSRVCSNLITGCRMF